MHSPAPRVCKCHFFIFILTFFRQALMSGGGGGDYRGGSEPKVGGGLAGIAGQFFDKPSVGWCTLKA